MQNSMVSEERRAALCIEEEKVPIRKEKEPKLGPSPLSISDSQRSEMMQAPKGVMAFRSGKDNRQYQISPANKDVNKDNFRDGNRDRDNNRNQTSKGRGIFSNKKKTESALNSTA